MFLYYIEQGEIDRLIQYNCSTQLKSYLFSTKYMILSVTVAEDVICVLEDKSSSDKLIAQIIN